MTLDANGPSTLYGMGAEILRRAQGCFVQMGVVPPDRQIVYPAPLPVDCAQLAVLFHGWTPQPQLQGLVTCMDFRWCGVFNVVVSRVTPALPGSRSAPTADQMDASARVASADAEVLLLLASSLEEVGADLIIETPAAQGGYQTVGLTATIPAFGGL